MTPATPARYGGCGGRYWRLGGCVGMAYRWATWLEDVLRDADVPVYAEPGWEDRGRPGGTFEPRGIMLHHDASPKGETSNGADVIVNGRPDLAGPLGNLWLAFDGTWHLCGAGRANHAGSGAWRDIPRDDANSYTIGIETDHTTAEQWSGDQYDSGTRGLVALADHLDIRGSASQLKDWLLAHKEWAPDRKVDPDPLDMDDLRALILAGGAPRGLWNMSTLKAFSYDQAQTFKGDGQWRTVHIGPDDQFSLLSGSAKSYMVTTGVTLARTDGADSVDTGDVVQFRYMTVNDYDDDRATTFQGKYPIHETVIGAGDSFANLEWLNSLKAASASGATARLRLFVMPPSGKRVTITRVLARIVHD